MSYTVVRSYQHILPYKIKLGAKEQNLDIVSTNDQFEDTTVSPAPFLSNNSNKQILVASTQKRSSSVSCQTTPRTMNSEGFVAILERVRVPLAEYQEKRGLAKNEHYGFVNLTSSMCQHSYYALLTIFAMLMNLVPLLEGFLYLARFVLDNLIEICNMDNSNEKIVRSAVFLGQLLIVFSLTMIICGFILFPVWYLFSQIVFKVCAMMITSAS